MKRKLILGLAILGCSVFLVLNFRASYAAPSPAPRVDTYDLSWYSVDGTTDVNTTRDNSYTLTGTAGEPDAGTQSGGSYNLDGGFWGFLDSISKLFLPLIMR